MVSPAPLPESIITTPNTPPDDDELVFTTSRKRRGVTVESESGERKRYVLVEMMSDGVAAWTKYQMTRARVDADGRPNLAKVDLRDHNSTLVSMCLYEADGTTPVPMAEIRDTFPASMLNSLYDICQTMNGLNTEGRDAAKKA